jgi:hypothetical protein
VEGLATGIHAMIRQTFGAKLEKKFATFFTTLTFDVSEQIYNHNIGFITMTWEKYENGEKSL